MEYTFTVLFVFYFKWNSNINIHCNNAFDEKYEKLR